MLIELLRPSGAELARRWVAALLLVPVEEREAVVASIEARIIQLYTNPADDEPAGTESAPPPLLHVASDPVQREGYTEQEIRSYAPTEEREAQQPEDDADNGGQDGRTAAG